MSVTSNSFDDQLVDLICVKKTTTSVPRLPNFLTQVLYSIQSIRQKRGRGGTLGEICSFIKIQFGATGDVRSRVETAINKAIIDGFIIKKDGQHMAVTPVARMQNATTTREKQAVIRLIQKIFLYKPNMRKPTGRSGKRESPFRNVSTATSPIPRRKTVSKSAVCAVLTKIESVLMKHLATPDDDDDDILCPPPSPPSEPCQQPLNKSDNKESNMKRSDMNIITFVKPKNPAKRALNNTADETCLSSKRARFSCEKKKHLSNNSKDSKDSRNSKNSKSSHSSSENAHRCRKSDANSRFGKDSTR